MKRSRLFIIALTLLFVGCSPTQSIIEWKSNPEHRGFVSTRMAKAVMQMPVIDEDEEDEVEELAMAQAGSFTVTVTKRPVRGVRRVQKRLVKNPKLSLKR